MCQQEKHTSSLAALSNELLLEIFHYLENDNQQDSTRPTPLKNLSLVNWRLRWLALPILMSSIVLVDSSMKVDSPLQRPPSGRVSNGMREAIQFISEEPTLRSKIKKLQLEISTYLDDSEKLDNEKWPKDDVTGFLSHLTGLKRLRVDTPNDYESSVRRHIRTMKSLVLPLQFSNVMTLVIDQTMVLLLEHCPRVRHLGLHNATNSGLLSNASLEKHARFAPDVIHFEAKARWSLADIEHLAQAWPNLHHIGVIPLNQKARLELSALINDLEESFANLESLSIAEFEFDSFWTGGVTYFSNLFQSMKCMHAQWYDPNGELDVPFEEFMSEHGGHKFMTDAMQRIFLDMKGLKECRLGDVIGARRSEDGDALCDSHEVYVYEERGVREETVVCFNWLGDSELLETVGGDGGERWLLKPL